MTSKGYIRIFLGIGMIALAAWTPWFVVAIAGICALIYYSTYYEIVVIGVLMDAVYGPTDYSIVYTLGAIVAFLISYAVKLRVRDKLRTTL